MKILKNKRGLFSMSVTSALVMMCFGSVEALSDEKKFKISPFVFVEGVGEEFKVEGVQTAHLVAVTGLKLEFKATPLDSLALIKGKGNFSSNGASIVSIATELGGLSYERDLSSDLSLPLFIKAAYLTRKVSIKKTKLHKSGKLLTDELDSRFLTTDLIAGLQFSLTKNIHVKLGAGLSKWHMDADVKDQLMLGPFRATTYREVNSKSINRVGEFSVEASSDNWSLFFDLSHRSLGSKAEEDINGVRLGGSYHF